MAESESPPPVESFTLPYRPGEFHELSDRLGKLAESLAPYPTLATVSQELHTAAVAPTRAEGLLSGAEAETQAAAQVEQEEPEDELPAEAPATATSEQAEGMPIGTRGEWQGRIGRQPEFSRVKGGRLRGEFYLAQHPDPNDPEKTEWLRCYNLDRFAEALQKKGRLAGAEVVVRGSFQGTRTLTRKDGRTEDQKTIFCYGIRQLRPGRNQPPGKS